MKTIELSAGRGSVLVSDEDFDWLSRFRWHWCNGYAYRAEKLFGVQTNYRMHREIMRALPGELVDHINGNKLDNRRENLRLATHRDNMRNSKAIHKTSAFKGVSWHTSKNRWRAVIKVNGVSRHVGYFGDERAAAAAYDEAAAIEFGEFARLNGEPA